MSTYKILNLGHAPKLSCCSNWSSLPHITQTSLSMVMRLINQGGKSGWLFERVNVTDGHKLSSLAAAPPTPSQPNKSPVYPDGGPPSQICTRSFPPKRGLCGFLFNFLSDRAVSYRSTPSLVSFKRPRWELTTVT